MTASPRVRRVARTPHRAVARTVTLVLATGLAVVGTAGAAGAWANAVSGTVVCATGGGWAVTWEVANSEPNPETITASDRPSAVPVGTTLEASQTRTFTETITTKPTADVALTLTAEWDTGDTSTDSGSIPAAAFADDCVVTPPPPPSTPTTPTTPPVVAPPVVAPPEVAPAEVRVVDARARHLDKCGRTSDLFKVAKRSGVVYTARGKQVREGVWLRAPRLAFTVRARAAGATYALEGRRVWRMTFTDRPCARAPEVAPDTGA